MERDRIQLDFKVVASTPFVGDELKGILMMDGLRLKILNFWLMEVEEEYEFDAPEDDAAGEQSISLH